VPVLRTSGCTYSAAKEPMERILVRRRQTHMTIPMHRVLLGSVVFMGTALCAVVLSACGSQAAGTASAPSAPAPITVHDSDNGKTINAFVGQKITVELGGPTVAGSTYWQFAPVAAGVLTSQGDQVVAVPSSSAQPSGGLINPPGMGMGTVSLTVQVETAGTGTITAHRDSCGEAMMCSPGNADYTLTINATA